MTNRGWTGGADGDIFCRNSPGLLAAIAIRRAPEELRWAGWLLAANAVAILVMFAIMMGVGQLVTRANVGLYQRGYSLTTMPWLAVLAWVLLRWRRRMR